MNAKLYAFVLALLLATPHPSHGYTADEFNWFPFFLQINEKPSVTIVLDNSESMTLRVHDEPFDPARKFAGYFDPSTYYTYDTLQHGQCFFPDNATGEWSGNFLNWATTTRLDAARKALTGGSFNRKMDCFIGSGILESSPAAEYDDSVPVTDVNDRLKFMTPHHEALTLSFHADRGHVLIRGQNFKEKLALHIRGPRNTGAIQNFGHRARLALFVFNGKNGGKLLHPMDDTPAHLQAIVDSIDTTAVTAGSPLAETLNTVLGYLRQDDTLDAETGPRYTASSYVPSKTEDPFLFPALKRLVPCTRQTVILVTDGRSTHDLGIPTDFRNLTERTRDSEYDLGPEGSPYLVDLAHFGHTRDLRPEEEMEGMQSFSLLGICAAGKRNTLLMDAVRYGNFNDRNGNILADLKEEYDIDGDGSPDGYFEAGPDGALEAAMDRAFRLATTGPAQGKPTATSIALSARDRTGMNLLYQSVFFPPSADAQSVSAWSGQIHAYFIDAKGNLREDTDLDGSLGMTRDRIVEFEDDAIYVHTDSDGDGIVSEEERNSTSLNSILDIRFPWSTTPWLNSLSNSEATSQRTDYASPIHGRYIFTFVDANGNMVPDSDEIQDFALSEKTNIKGAANDFQNYLTLFESHPGDISLDLSNPIQRDIDDLRRNNPSAFEEFLGILAKRQVDFIRGAEVGNASIHSIPDNVRSRTRNGETWRLGDIINSHPVSVGRPAENYHLIYGDKTYEAFVKAYADRRQVVYAGANDGMLHAFNAELEDCGVRPTEFSREGRTCFPPGMELWAYVPFNLLPHLKWLMHPEYGQKLHSAYMDLEPRVFDARIFFGPDGITPLDEKTYPGGWGTVLVAGMRMGGAKIRVDTDKRNGDFFDPNTDRTLSSSYVIMDVTNPERPPVLLAEIALPCQGFTTCRPAVMPIHSPFPVTRAVSEWYLVFGSGPATADGSASSIKLGNTSSEQAGRIFVVDLKALVTERTVKTIEALGRTGKTLKPFATLENASFVSQPIAVDLDIPDINADGTFATDVVYFGTVSGDADFPSGKAWRLVTRNTSPEHWVVSTLMDVKQPISAAPTVAMGEKRHLWIYFGTGRLFDSNDVLQNQTMGFYGVREPENNGNPSWESVQLGNLFDSTNLSLESERYSDEMMDKNNNGTDSSQIIEKESDSQLKNKVALAGGWKIRFAVQEERVLSQAALFDDMVLFASHISSLTPCYPDSRNRLWTLNYETGSSWMSTSSENVHAAFHPPMKATGTSITIPTYHKIRARHLQSFHQASTGNISSIQFPYSEKNMSGVVFWGKKSN